jgi:hypothetical protein
MWILKGALGGLSLGMYTMWNTYKEIELHNKKLEFIVKTKIENEFRQKEHKRI